MTDQLKKYCWSDDVFTTPGEAVYRSIELGLGINAHIIEGRDGTVMYRPGQTPEMYLSLMASLLDVTIEQIRTEIVKHKPKPTPEGFVKVDTEQRIVYGWANVAAIDGNLTTDSHGESIDPEDLEKAANEYMLGQRKALAQHAGEQVATVIHSLPITPDIKKALGLGCSRDGLVIAMKVHDDDTWAAIKSGKLKSFSIGGTARVEEVEDAD